MAWAKRHPRAWLAAAVVALLLGAGYVGVAVAGLRQIERTWLEARALGDEYQRAVTSLTASQRREYRITLGDDTEERLRRLTLDYGERMALLADAASGVLAVDPRVRRARAAVVRELRSVVRDSRGASGRGFPALAPFPYRAAVEPSLDAARGRWRLDAGTAPDSPPLTTAPRRQATPPLHSEPTGVRLLTFVTGSLLEIDIDGGAVRERGSAHAFAVVGDRLVLVEGGQAQVVEPGGGRRSLGTAELVRADGDGLPAVWWSGAPSEGPDDISTLVGRIGLDGSVQVSPRRVDGYFAMAGGRWLVALTPGGEAGAGFAVHDVERPGFRLARPTGHPLALAQGVLVWQDVAADAVDTAPRVRDLTTGTERRLAPPTAGATAGTVSFALDRRSFAVAWAPPPSVSGDTPHTVWTYDVATLTGLRTPITAGPFVPSMAWSRDGTWLFALEQDGETGRILVWRNPSDVAAPLAVEGAFLTLTAL